MFLSTTVLGVVVVAIRIGTGCGLRLEKNSIWDIIKQGYAIPASVGVSATKLVLQKNSNIKCV